MALASHLRTLRDFLGPNYLGFCLVEWLKVTSIELIAARLRNLQR